MGDLIFYPSIPVIAQEEIILDKIGDKVQDNLNSVQSSQTKWEKTPVKNHEVEVSNPSRYLAFLDAGTGIYGPAGRRIEPKNSLVLHWINNAGESVYAKSVRGIPARNFIQPTISMSLQEVLNGYR